MARVGVPAYDSGMRGKEAPSEKPRRARSKKGAKRGVKRITIESGKTGHEVQIERHQPKPKIQDGVSSPVSYEEPEKHHYSDVGQAKEHVTSAMDELSDGSEED